MGRKQVFAIGLLPSRRAVRVLKMDSRRMLEVAKRVSEVSDAAAPKEPSRAEMVGLTQRQTIAMCVRGLTLDPVEVAYLKNSEPVAPAAPAAPVIGASEAVDFDATLGPLKDPKDRRWTALGEMQLADDSDDNELSMFELFEDPNEWKAVLDIIAMAGGGGFGTNPFGAKVLKTSAGS